MFKLYEVTKDQINSKNAKRINSYLKKTRIKNANIYGALAGSFPIWGKYIHFTYPN
jgi:hypothetical protein